MRKNVNTVHIEGRIYQHSLEVKEVKNQNSANFGKQYIGGVIEVATDEAGLSVIPVEFTFVTETTKNGGKNKTYAELMKIIEHGKTWITDGAEAATKVSIDTALALNDFPAQDGTMVSQKVNRGGFINIVGELKENIADRCKFKTDMLITNVTRIEADPEKHIDADYAVIRGAVFDFRNALLPVEFVTKNPAAMQYFEGLEATSAQPTYTQVWGMINYKTESFKQEVESAFGEPTVDVRERKVREWVITGALKVPYDFGDEKVMTEEEVMKASQDRQVYLADIKKKREEYLEQKNANAPSAFGTPATPAPSVAAAPGKFTF